MTGYVICSGTFSLSANVPKTIISIVSVNEAPVITQMSVSFKGTTQTDAPALVELCLCSQISSGVSNPVVAAQVWGTPQLTPTVVPSIGFTTEPTVIVPIRQWFITPAGGVLDLQYPLGREPMGAILASTTGKGILLRVTASAAVTCTGYMEWGE